MRAEQLIKCLNRAGVLLNRFKPPVIFHITARSKAVLLIWFSVFACFGVIFVLFSPSVCLDDIQLGLGS